MNQYARSIEEVKLLLSVILDGEKKLLLNLKLFLISVLALIWILIIFKSCTWLQVSLDNHFTRYKYSNTGQLFNRSTWKKQPLAHTAQNSRCNIISHNTGEQIGGWAQQLWYWIDLRVTLNTQSKTNEWQRKTKRLACTSNTCHRSGLFSSQSINQHCLCRKKILYILPVYSLCETKHYDSKENEVCHLKIVLQQPACKWSMLTLLSHKMLADRWQMLESPDVADAQGSRICETNKLGVNFIHVQMPAICKCDVVSVSLKNMEESKRDLTKASLISTHNFFLIGCRCLVMVHLVQCQSTE